MLLNYNSEKSWPASLVVKALIQEHPWQGTPALWQGLVHSSVAGRREGAAGLCPSTVPAARYSLS